MNIRHQDIQADKYAFPYHYIPQVGCRTELSRHWRFAASYIAALNLIADRLRSLSISEGKDWCHVDIGCGDGALIYHLSQLQDFKARQFTGIDIDERAIRWARMFNTESVFHDVDLMTLKDEFSSCSLIEVLEHVQPELLPSFVADVARLIRPRGVMVATVPSIEKPLARKHFQHFSFQSITDLLTPAFSNIHVLGFEHHNWVTRLVDQLRANKYFYLDSPFLNRIAINYLQRTHHKQAGCGRLLVVAERLA